jgi:hypothetical protein
MKALFLAGILSIAAASAVQAGGKVVGSDFHANAASAGDTGQSVASSTARSGQIPRFWHPVLAGDGGPSGPGDDTGRSGTRMADDGPVGAGDHNGRSSAALSQSGGEYRVASIKGGATGDF